jgi:hypothetical protein
MDKIERKRKKECRVEKDTLSLIRFSQVSRVGLRGNRFVSRMTYHVETSGGNWTKEKDKGGEGELSRKHRSANPIETEHHYGGVLKSTR